MDVNQTRFHLLLSETDWLVPAAERATAAGSLAGWNSALFWDEERAELTLRPVLTPPTTGSAPAGATPRAARDEAGRWYWLEGDEIKVLLPDGTAPQHFWSPAEWNLPHAHGTPKPGEFHPVASPPAPLKLRLRGLTVTNRQFLVVGVIPDPQREKGDVIGESGLPERAGLLAFDLYAGDQPRWIGWPNRIHFAPLDLAPAPCGGVWVLDGGIETARYWLLDRNLRVCHQDTPHKERVSKGGFAHLAEPGHDEHFWHEDAYWLLPDIHPIAIEGLPDGTVLFLNPGSPSQIYRYQAADRVGKFDLLIPPGTDRGRGWPIQGYDLAYQPASGLVYVAEASGGQAFAFDLTHGFQFRYLPLFGFGYKGLVAAGDEVWYDRGDTWLPLVEQARRRESPGILTTRVLDGREPDCVWDRLLIDGEIPQGAAIQVESRAANSVEELAGAAWRLEPLPYRRSGVTDLPWHRPYPDSEEGGAWELLLQQATGRYLQVRLTLTAAGRATPRIRAMRVWYPRFSYLKQYLPDVYQEDAVSASFTERFLANPEGLLTALEEQIAQAQYLFDVRTVPEEYLPWLAGWFDVMLDESWPPWRKRLFLRHASELFAQRGTLQGMLRAVRLATDPSPDDTLFTADVTAEKPVRGLAPTVRIRESFRQKDGKAHRFVVQVPASGYGVSGGIDPEVVRRIVQQEKPAHTRFDIQSYWAMFRVGEARLGIDSVLGRAPRLAPLMLGQGYTAQTYLGYPPPWNLADRLLAGRDRLGSTPSL